MAELTLEIADKIAEIEEGFEKVMGHGLTYGPDPEGHYRGEAIFAYAMDESFGAESGLRKSMESHFEVCEYCRWSKEFDEDIPGINADCAAGKLDGIKVPDLRKMYDEHLAKQSK